jgi:glucosyl-dolichyl phosphate glucuronosyltransferase
VGVLNSISVIVSTYTPRRLSDVLECLDSISRQTLPPSETILVLDPIDELVEFYRSRVPPNVKIVISDGIGLSYARNAGVKNASGDIVAFIDDDAVADKKWLESSVENYRDSQVIGVGGLINADWANNRPMWFPEELDWIVGCSYKGMPMKRSVIRNPIGCNMSFRKIVFEKAGYFRTDIGRLGDKLLCSEETEFAIRALDAMPGSRIVFEPSAAVSHKVGKKRESLKYVWTRSFNEGMSKATISYKSDSSKMLSTEDSYLKFLLSVAIPSRIKRIYRISEASELLTLKLSILAVLAGFATVRVMRVIRRS